MFLSDSTSVSGCPLPTPSSSPSPSVSPLQLREKNSKCSLNGLHVFRLRSWRALPILMASLLLVHCWTRLCDGGVWGSGVLGVKAFNCQAKAGMWLVRWQECGIAGIFGRRNVCSHRCSGEMGSTCHGHTAQQQRVLTGRSNLPTNTHYESSNFTH